MVLGSQGPGRVGRRRFLHLRAAPTGGSRSLNGVEGGARAAPVSRSGPTRLQMSQPAGACPSSQTGRRRSARPCSATRGHGRGADLRARRDHPRPARADPTIERPAVRVRRGGGRHGPRVRPGGCLAQRGELDGRVHGRTHQLAERALVRSADRRGGEHVFVKLGRRPDGTARRARPPRGRAALFGSAPPTGRGAVARELARRRLSKAGRPVTGCRCARGVEPSTLPPCNPSSCAVRADPRSSSVPRRTRGARAAPAPRCW